MRRSIGLEIAGLEFESRETQRRGEEATRNQGAIVTSSGMKLD